MFDRAQMLDVDVPVAEQAALPRVEVPGYGTVKVLTRQHLDRREESTAGEDIAPGIGLCCECCRGKAMALYYSQIGCIVLFCPRTEEAFGAIRVAADA